MSLMARVEFQGSPASPRGVDRDAAEYQERAVDRTAKAESWCHGLN
jgi:hypothetical protein